MIQARGDNGTQWILDLNNGIVKEGCIPEDWKSSVVSQKTSFCLILSNSKSINQSKVICNVRNVVHKLKSEAVPIILQLHCW